MAHRILKNAIILSSTQVFSRILSFTFFLILARYFGSEFFGKYYYVYTLIFLLTFISDAGLSTLLIREIVKLKERVGNILLHSVIIRIFFSILVYSALVITIYFQPDLDVDKKNLIYLLGFYVFSKALFEYSLNYFQGVEKQGIYGLLLLLNNILLVAITLFFIYGRTYFIIFSIIPVIATLVSATVGFYLVNQQVSFKFKILFGDLIFLIKRTIPFGLTLFVSAASARMGIIIISWLSTDIQVGQYGVANRLIEGVMIIPIVINKITYPLLSNLKNNPLKFQWTLDATNKVLLLCTSVIVIVCNIYAEDIITILFTNLYIDAVIVFQVLCWMLLGSFPNYIIGHALFSIDKQREVLKISGLMLFINIYFNFILIPKFGIMGVALTTVFTVVVTFIAYLRILKKYYKIMDIFKNWVKITMLCIIIVSVGLFLRSVIPEIVTALCLIFLYCFGIYFFKLISKQEITEFKLFLTQKGM